MNVSLSYSKQLSVNVSDNILSVDIKYMISILCIIILNQFIMYEMYLSYMSSEYVILYFKCNAP